MLRLVLMIALCIFIARAFWRIVDSFMEGMTGQSRQTGAPPQRGVQMARCAVCGTFVVPDRAVVLSDGRARRTFCSEACRDKFRRTA